VSEIVYMLGNPGLGYPHIPYIGFQGHFR